MHFQRTSRLLLVVTLLVGPSWVAPAAAETFTATWDYNLKAESPRPEPVLRLRFCGCRRSDLCTGCGTRAWR